MINLKVSVLLFIVFLLCSCSSEDDTPPPSTTPNVPPGVEDIRSQYKVRTLTEPFNGSGDATIDASGFIYVADFGNQVNNADGTQITKVDPVSGALSVFATGLNGPSGNAFDSQGNLFQSNIRGNSISKIDKDGFWNLFVNTNLAGPIGIVIDDDDNLYVCNCSGRTISKITPDGTHTVLVQSNLLNCPNGIARDDNGNLYPVNFNNGDILKVTPSGDISILASLPGNSAAHIDYINGELYVVARNANQLYKSDLNGNLSLLAGSGTGGNTDGDGSSAEFNIPNGLAVSKDGSKIYMIDRVRGVGTPLNPVTVRVIEKK